jgi:chemotaxis methyl-accepting protein methylase
MINFDQPTREQILKRMNKAMRPDGQLFPGGGETLITMNVAFTRETLVKAVFCRTVAV